MVGCFEVAFSKQASIVSPAAPLSIMHEDLFTRHERMCATHVWSFLICHTQSKLTVWTAIIRSNCVRTRRSAANTRVVTFIYDQFWHTEVSLS